MKMRQALFSIRRGFTIMETLLAIGIISMLLGIFLTLFLPAKDMVRSALSREESERITGILRSEMTRLRANERLAANAKKSSNNQFISGFDKGFRWIQRSSKPGTAIAIFSYRADTSQPIRVDGTYPAVKAGKTLPSATNNLISMACPIDDRLHKDDIRNAVGPAFLVRMTHLEETPGGDYRLANRPGLIGNAGSPESYVSKAGDEDGWGAVIFYRADFFLMSPPSPERFNRLSWEQMGKPVFSANLSIRR